MLQLHWQEHWKIYEPRSSIRLGLVQFHGPLIHLYGPICKNVGVTYLLAMVGKDNLPWYWVFHIEMRVTKGLDHHQILTKTLKTKHQILHWSDIYQNIRDISLS